ncbi:MAG: DoxX family membrane protein [Vulcanimicrobiaceae bacterium]
MFPLEQGTDAGLLFLRVMTGLVYADSGYSSLKDPEARAKSNGLPKPVMQFIAAAELAGAAGIIFGVLQQLAAIGLILIMLGAIQKKVFVWKTGFWGKDGFGWSYDTMLCSRLLVILFTDGGAYVLVH